MVQLNCVTLCSLSLSYRIKQCTVYEYFMDYSYVMCVYSFVRSGEFHLGFPKSDLQGVSWYQLLHWESMREAQNKHRLSKS